MHQPGIEPGSQAYSVRQTFRICHSWEAHILPLNHWCFIYPYSTVDKFLYILEIHFSYDK